MAKLISELPVAGELLSGNHVVVDQEGNAYKVTLEALGAYVGISSGEGNAALLQGQEGSYYLARTNHTGAQAISTVTGLQAALDGKAPTFQGRHAVSATSGSVEVDATALGINWVVVTEDLTGNLDISFATANQTVRKVGVYLAGDPGAFTAKVSGLIDPASGEVVFTAQNQEIDCFIAPGVGVYGAVPVSGGAPYTPREVVIAASRALTTQDYEWYPTGSFQYHQIVKIQRASDVPITLTLPAAAGNAWARVFIVIDDTHASPVTIDVATGEINGRSSVSMLVGKGAAAWLYLLEQSTGPDSSSWRAEGAISQSRAEGIVNLGTLSGTAGNVDLGAAEVFKATLDADITTAIVPINVPEAGQASFTVKLCQDGTGGHAWLDPSGTILPDDEPALPTDPDALVLLHYTTDDGGLTWLRLPSVPYT